MDSNPVKIQEPYQQSEEGLFGIHETKLSETARLGPDYGWVITNGLRLVAEKGEELVLHKIQQVVL